MAAEKSSSVYGGRARLGIVVPTTNTVNEPEWWSLLPVGVSLHVARMPLHLGQKPKGDLPEALAQALDQLRPARLSVAAYACTAGSLVLPPRAMSDRIAARIGGPALTTAEALVLALRALGASRIAVATPYGETLNRHEARFLEACGFDVAAIAGLGHGEGGAHEFAAIAATPLAAVAEHVRAVVARAGRIDAVLISCTDFPSLPLIAPLEAELGAPVVTSNSAGLWACLRRAGADDAPAAGGRLFSLPAAAARAA